MVESLHSDLKCPGGHHCQTGNTPDTILTSIREIVLCRRFRIASNWYKSCGMEIDVIVDTIVLYLLCIIQALLLQIYGIHSEFILVITLKW